MNGLAVIILAAGLGKRMHSKVPKVLHPVAGYPMLLYAVDLSQRLKPDTVIVVVGRESNSIRALLATKDDGRLVMIDQPEQRGTGDAVMVAKAAVGDEIQAVLILNGDVPLLSDPTIRKLLDVHQDSRPSLTMLTAGVESPKGYGRVVRGRDGRVAKIVEETDASEDERRINEINAGTYVADGPFLFEALRSIRPDNAQGEYYLTDAVEIAVSKGRGVIAVIADDSIEALGVNSRVDLARVEGIMRRRIRERVMAAGVTCLDPASTFIDHGVVIGQDTVLSPHTTIEGTTVIGEECVIRSCVRIADSTIGNNVKILDSCVISGATVGDGATVGPFTHLRPGTVLEHDTKVGNFVEMKQAVLGRGSKANHLSYLGDAKIGKDVNIGAGAITCNYDGKDKHETVIEDGVFIGSDSQFVAPVRIGRGAVIAAGSTITDDVPPDALAIARSPQVIKPSKRKKG